MVLEGDRDAQAIKSAMRQLISSEVPEAVIDYIEVTDDETVQPVDEIKAAVLVALAVRIGGTRLIDNVTLRP